MSTAQRLRRRAATVLSATALAGSGLLLTAGPAEAAACESTGSGVTVVVTYPGGGTSVRCAPGDPASGADALAGAGFAITQVQTMPGFVCRIDGQPASDPCVRTPPTTAYWSYWYAVPGGSWTYSSAGAYGRNPAPGTVEGWAFGAGSPPAVAPPAVAAPAPPPPPPPPPAPAPAPSTTTSKPKPAPAPSTTAAKPAAPSSTTSSAGDAAASDDSGGPAATDAASAATETPTEDASAGATATDSPTTAATVDSDSDGADATAAGATSVSTDGAGSSSAALTLAGLGVAGALLGAAGWMGWRRRIGD